MMTIIFIISIIAFRVLFSSFFIEYNNIIELNHGQTKLRIKFNYNKKKKKKKKKKAIDKNRKKK